MEHCLGVGAHGAVYDTGNDTVVKKTKVVDRRQFGIYLADGLVNELVTSFRLHRNCTRCRSKVVDWKINAKGESELYMQRLLDFHCLPLSKVSENAPKYISNLFTALSDMHECGVAHCDVKLNNLLWDCRTNQLVLIDYGLSKIDVGVKPKESARFMPQYKSPEAYLDSKSVDLMAADVWAAGVCSAAIIMSSPRKTFFKDCGLESMRWKRALRTVLKAINGELPKPRSRTGRRRYSDYSHKYRSAPFNPMVPSLIDCVAEAAGPAAADFVKKVLDPDPETRLTAKQALEHPYISRCCEPFAPQAPSLDFSQFRPVSQETINLVIRACVAERMCPEAAFKAIDVLHVLEQSHSPAVVAAALSLASCIADNELKDIKETFATVCQEEVSVEELNKTVVAVLAEPRVVAALEAPSLLSEAKLLDASIDGTRKHPSVRALFTLYCESKGLRPGLAQILSAISGNSEQQSEL